MYVVGHHIVTGKTNTHKPLSLPPSSRCSLAGRQTDTEEKEDEDEDEEVGATKQCNMDGQLASLPYLFTFLTSPSILSSMS